MTNRIRLNLLAATVGCAVVGGIVGCQSTAGKLAAINPISGIGESEAPIGVPDRVVATWTEAVLHQSGEGTRGFGGRLFFYERGTAEPVRVNGRLVVYAFAEDDRQASDNRPTKRFVFPAEQFVRHESESEIGTSYSVWLPWDAAGGAQAEVSLIARFEPSQGGGLVVSDQTRQRLPGRARQQTLIAEDQKPTGVRQASTADSGQPSVNQANFQQLMKENEKAPSKKPGLTATTISLPGRFQKPAAAAQPVAPSVALSQLPPSSKAPEPTPVGTTVEYLTPGESVRRSLRPRSFDSSHE